MKDCEIENCVYHCGKYNGQYPNASEFEALSNLYKVLGDRTRLKIVFCLLAKKCCVQEICHCVNLSQSLVSHQLKVLRDNKIVVTERNKNKIYYTLADNLTSILLSIAGEHIDEL